MENIFEAEVKNTAKCVEMRISLGETKEEALDFVRASVDRTDYFFEEVESTMKSRLDAIPVDSCTLGRCRKEKEL